MHYKPCTMESLCLPKLEDESEVRNQDSYGRPRAVTVWSGRGLEREPSEM